MICGLNFDVAFFAVFVDIEALAFDIWARPGDR